MVVSKELRVKVKVHKITSWDLVITNKELELARMWAVDNRKHHALEMSGHL